jgi:serine/threonine protein phosphatase PrpC
MERVADQRVGADKYLKRQGDYLRVSAQQEDRYFESSFVFGTERYWLGAVFDGVSTCDYGSGAQIAEVSRTAIEHALAGLGEREDVADLVMERGSEVILDYLQRHIEKAISFELERLRKDADVDLQSPNINTPTSTATLALIDAHGQVWMKWVGDSPALVLTERGELFTLSAPHSVKHDLVYQGEEIGDAIRLESGSSLTTDLSALALGHESRIDHRAYQLSPGDTLLLCSDGLIDGFKERSKRLGADALALDCIEDWIREERLSVGEEVDLYRLVNQLCYQADSRRGVDNITALGMKPLWRTSAVEKPRKSKRREGSGSRYKA